MTPPSSQPTEPTFWRDAALPFIEARAIADGRALRYGRHAHRTLSVGAVTGGRSSYLNGHAVEPIGAGALVVVNPDTVHACNPADAAPWSYRMFYLDPAWLASLRHDERPFRPFLATWTMRADLFDGLNRLYGLLTNPHADALQKHGAAIDYFSALQRALDPAPPPRREPNRRLARAAEYIDDNYTQPLKLDDICAAANLSASYLVRAFKARYGMTPHAYMVNRRIEFSRAQLRRGRAIAEVAAAAGFADQAHLQRAFRQFVAATPGRYRG